MKKNNFFAKFTGKFQYVAGAMMIPIIVLVVCGLLMGFISPFVNYVFTPGTFMHTTSLLFVRVGSMIMGNLPLWFVVGISFGLAKNNKGYAALAGVFMLMGVNMVISTLSTVNGFTPEVVASVEELMKMGFTENEALVQSKLFTQVLGIFTYDTSIFGAIVTGGVIGAAMNKWGDIELPNLLSFFAGPKFVVVLVPVFSVAVGSVLYFLWPAINSAITNLSILIGKSGLLGTFIYGVTDRALLPFGMHHLITMPLRYTELGGEMIIDGMKIIGTTNLENALIASPTATSYLIRNFTSGRILVNLGGWPGAGLAMYLTAPKEKRNKVLGILLPAIFTATVVGVTEPIEFTALFASPVLYYFVHVPLSGLAFFLAELTKVSIQGFAVIFMIPNILQPAKVHAMSLLYLVPLYFGLYFFVFRWAILKFDIKTPGRGESLDLVSKKEYQLSKGLIEDETTEELDLVSKIIDAFGGLNNIKSVENCATRLRVCVEDNKIVKDKYHWTNHVEAIGVVNMNNDYQIIYGPRVTNISSKLNQVLANKRKEVK